MMVKYELTPSSTSQCKGSVQTQITNEDSFEHFPFDEAPYEKNEAPFDEPPLKGTAPSLEKYLKESFDEKRLRANICTDLERAFYSSPTSAVEVAAAFGDIPVTEIPKKLFLTKKKITKKSRLFLLPRTRYERARNSKIGLSDTKGACLEEYLPAIELFLENQEAHVEPARDRVKSPYCLQSCIDIIEETASDETDLNSLMECLDGVQDPEDYISIPSSTSPFPSSEESIHEVGNCPEVDSGILPSPTFISYEDANVKADFPEPGNDSKYGCITLPWFEGWRDCESPTFDFDIICGRKALSEPPSPPPVGASRDPFSSSVKNYLMHCSIFLDDDNASVASQDRESNYSTPLLEQNCPEQDYQTNRRQRTPVRRERPSPLRVEVWQNRFSATSRSLQNFLAHFVGQRASTQDSDADSNTASETESLGESESDIGSMVRGLDFISLEEECCYPQNASRGPSLCAGHDSFNAQYVVR
jgi:hypothetical protein